MLLIDPRRLRTGRKLARLAADRAALRFVHGLQLLMDRGIADIGATPRETVLQDGKLEVWRYERRESDEFELGHDTHVVDNSTLPVPILIVPPLMVRPYIYDLRSGHSMVNELRRARFDVFMVDFGVPDADDKYVKLDDYVLDYMPKAVEAVRRQTGRAPITIAGYCMGGIFGLLYTAAWRDRDVKNLITIAAPIDFSKMGMLSVTARLAHNQVAFLADRIGNIPGQLNSQALKMLAPIKRFTRYADLFVNLWNEEYVRGFESMSRWANDFIPYPRDAFKQFVEEMMVGNKLVQGMTFGQRVADLREIESSILAFAGKTDQIAPPASARAIAELCQSNDFEYLEVPGGHIGVVAGSRAREEVWEKMVRWLRPRSV